ncbi:helix-turn-helix transcriptional regulator [Gulosibacter molinativorax]|uniref:LuxR family transcriptional regulator n=1 Tax=Gulosibacter molinativorax TaxID=256821 RepID=A0ABT7CAA7_9MICO|nr:helix-turn-helix transcriptional regulator [Gulosibacter molinativorax]MDJ1371682.1 LuxR family transcriptional regulator [Gulosibacter molinativorax]QUY63104.1 LuxR family transcriptional regulator [Gulosibacter molinativorax]
MSTARGDDSDTHRDSARPGDEPHGDVVSYAELDGDVPHDDGRHGSELLSVELLSAARVQARNGSPQRAWELAQKVAVIGRTTHNPQLLADAALVLTAPSVGAWNLSADRHTLALEAIRMLGDTDPHRTARLRALMEVTRNPWYASADLPDPDRLDPDRLDEEQAERRSAELHARASRAAGARDVNTRLECADALAELAANSGRTEDAAWASLWRLDAYCQLGKRVELNADLMEFGAIVRRLDAPIWHWRLAACRASVALLDGNLEDATDLMDRALELGQSLGSEEAIFVDLVMRSAFAAQTGTNLDAIEPLVRVAIADAPFLAQTWHARILLAQGRKEDAVAIWHAIRPNIDRIASDTREWIVALATLAELCFAAEDAEAAATLREQLLPLAGQHVTGGILTPYEGPVSRFLGLLSLALGDRVTARNQFQDAFEESERMHAKLHAARAQQLLERYGGDHGILTRRELDVARLVAEGLTNKEIAARLFLSERTVESHVSHVIRKLETSGRAGVAHKLGAP